MGKKITRGQSTKSETLGKKTIVKNVLLVSKTTLQYFLYRILHTVWIVFQEKYEVFRQ